MDDLVHEYLGFLAYERGLSPRTREAYEHDLADFRAYVETLGKTWATVLTDDVSAYFAANAGLKDSTRARRLVAIKGLFAYAVAENRLEHNPAAILKAPRRAKVLPHVLQRAEVERLLATPPEETREGLRDRALLELLYGCGLRASEAAGLPLDAVDFDEAVVRVRGKGAKVRLVPFGQKAEAALHRYLGPGGRDAFHPEPGQSALFLTPLGNPLSRADAWTIVKTHARAAGLSTTSTHWLRHSFATHLLSGGAPIRAIQELLGHADISTTQVYTHLDAKRLAKAVRDFHPRS